MKRRNYSTDCNQKVDGIVPARTVERPTGRRVKDNILRLAEEVSTNKEEILRNATEETVRSLVYEQSIFCKEECPYITACYINEIDRPYNGEHPKYGMRCPLECDLLFRFFYGYIAELMIDGDRPTEVQSAAELAAIKIMRRRIDILIKEETNGTMMQDRPIPVGKDVIMDKVPHAMFSIKRDLERRETEVKKELMATREQMIKSKQVEQSKQRLTLPELIKQVVVDGESEKK